LKKGKEQLANKIGWYQDKGVQEQEVWTPLYNVNQKTEHSCKTLKTLYILCSSRKYPYSPHRRFFVLHPTPPKKFQFSFILCFKTPLPLEISNDLPWGGYRFFLELQKNFEKKLSCALFTVHSHRLA